MAARLRIALDMIIRLHKDDICLPLSDGSEKTLNHVEQSVTTQNYWKLMQSTGTSGPDVKLRYIVRVTRN